MNVSVLCSIILLYLTTVVERSKTVAWCHCAWLSTTKGSWERCRNSWLVFSLWERNQCPPNAHISWYEWKSRVVSFYTTFVPLYAIYGLSKSSLLHSDTNLFTFFIFFSRSFEDFEILHGDMQGLTDTMSFLKSLSGLVGNDLRSPEKQTRERAAASVLFDWEVLSSLYNSGVWIPIVCAKFPFFSMLDWENAPNLMEHPSFCLINSVNMLQRNIVEQNSYAILN